jgi:hypothetical protein
MDSESEEYQMNELKLRTHKNYTAWDLNCPRIVHIKNRQKMEAMFKRAARRQMKRELKGASYE